MNILFQILLINIFYDQQSQCNNFLWSYPIYVFFYLQTGFLSCEFSRKWKMVVEGPKGALKVSGFLFMCVFADVYLSETCSNLKMVTFAGVQTCGW